MEVLHDAVPEGQTDSQGNATEALKAAGIPVQGYSEEQIFRRFRMPNRKKEQVQYELTRDPGLLHQYYLMRENMYISVWGLDNFHGSHDAFDEISDICIAKLGNQCIGGGRMTYSSPGHRLLLPMEGEDFSLTQALPQLELHRHTYLEFSRLAILPEFQYRETSVELYDCALRHAIRRGARYGFALAPHLLARKYCQGVSSIGYKASIRRDVKVPDREEYEGIPMALWVLDFAESPAVQKLHEAVKTHESALAEA